MRKIVSGLFLLLSPWVGSAAAMAAPDDRAALWWSHVQILASDAYEGRGTGKPGYDKAADYVIGQLRALGLQPAGTDGYRQPVAFVEQVILADGSSARLVGPQGATPLSVPGDIIFSGSGLHLPEAGHDDFAGLDLKGKIVVVLSGGPSSISGALKSHARSERAGWLAKRGALGLIQLVTRFSKHDKAAR